MSSSNSTSSLTEDDVAYLDAIGLAIAQDSVSLMCESIFWTMYLAVFIFAIRIQIRRGIRTRPTIGMLVVTCALFASCTSLWIMNVVLFFRRQDDFFRRYPDLGLEDRWIITNDHVLPYGLPMETLFLVNMIVGDAVVIWRAWVLWQGARTQRLVYIPMFMLLASFVFAAISLQCLASDNYGTKSTIATGSRTCQWGEPIAWAISLLTNVTSTTLIAVKAWQHRQSLRDGLGRSHHKSMSERVLALLVESGFIYCLFWLSQVILFINIEWRANATFVYMFFSTIGDQISGIYPTAIIVLVNMQRSMDVEVHSLKIESRRNPHEGDLPPMKYAKASPAVNNFTTTSLSQSNSATTSTLDQNEGVWAREEV